MWIVVMIFLLAVGVVAFVLYRTDQTLKDAQKAADKAGKVTGDVKAIGDTAVKAWSDIKELFK